MNRDTDNSAELKQDCEQRRSSIEASIALRKLKFNSHEYPSCMIRNTTLDMDAEFHMDAVPSFV